MDTFQVGVTQCKNSLAFLMALNEENHNYGTTGSSVTVVVIAGTENLATATDHVCFMKFSVVLHTMRHSVVGNCF